MFEKVPSCRQDRWASIGTFIDRWYSPLTPGDGYTEEELVLAEESLGFRLPAALREWYAQSGKRNDIWQTQDFFYSPTDLKINGGLLEFYRENQGCFTWSIAIDAIARDDPPVVCDWGGSIRQVSRTISEYAIQQLLYTAKFNPNVFAGFSAACCDRVLRAIQTQYVPCDLPDWYVFGATVSFFEGLDIILEVWSSDRGREFWFATPTQKIKEEVEDFLAPFGAIFD